MKRNGVFEVKVNNKNRSEILKKINETRLTKEFFEECAKTAKKLRKDKHGTV